jgi:hypothetical protein
MYDVTLISVPFSIIENPPLGIAVLKGAVESDGFTCKTIDLGMDLYARCNNDRAFFDSVQTYFSTPNTKASDEILNVVDKFVNQWAIDLVNSNSRWIGISVFSYYAHYSTFLLCSLIKKLNPLQKIVIGGPGSGTKMTEEMWGEFQITEMEKLLSYGDIFKKRKLVDAWILGDGEQALIDLLRGNTVGDEFHIESYRNQNHPYANFDDFDLSLYQGQLNRGLPQIPIFSSKGCVRNCDFCDVNVVQNRFRFRNGKNIVDEMIHLADRHNYRDFIFLDSLANGSLKSLKEWVTELAEYNKNNPDKRITWSASGWICRPIGQIPESFYATLAASGLQTVSIGMETGSNNVLAAMNKKTNVEALYYEIEQFRKNDIKFIGLLLLGHWAEQWEDFLDTAVLIYRLSRYARTGNLVSVTPGVTFSIIDDTPADLDFDKNKLIKHAKKIIWWTQHNPSLTAKERYFRLILLTQLMDKLKVPLMQPVIPYVKLVVEKNIDEIKEFYQSVTKDLSELPTQYSKYYLDNFDKFLDLVTARAGIEDSIDISFELESSVTNDTPPIIEIILNDQVVYSNALGEGLHSIVLNHLPLQDTNTLAMRFLNKNPHDTIVDADGNIVKDKFVSIKKFVVDRFDLYADADFFYNQLTYYQNDISTDVSPGFWFNDSKILLTFTNPFELWYTQRSSRYSQFDAFIITETTLPNERGITNYNQGKSELIELLEQLDY